MRALPQESGATVTGENQPRLVLPMLREKKIISVFSRAILLNLERSTPQLSMTSPPSILF
jgi:hypothetical protein